MSSLCFTEKVVVLIFRTLQETLGTVHAIANLTVQPFQVVSIAIRESSRYKPRKMETL